MSVDRPTENQPWFVQRPPSSVDSRRSTAGYRSVYPGAGSLDAEVDLRAEMDYIMQTRGHKVYLRRAEDRRCACWNETTREAAIDCPHCTGTGWLYHDELVLTRKMPVTDPTVAALLERRSAIGLAGVPQYVFWFEHTVSPGPSKRDRILEVTLGDDGEPVKAVKVEKQWNIGQVQDYRDKYGRIEFWGCWVREGVLGKE